MSKSNKILHCGIDFGTTNSSLAISTFGTPSIVPIDRQNTNIGVLRSLIYLNPLHQQSVGYEAINRYLSDLTTLPSVPLRQELTGRLIKTFGPSGSSGAGPVIWVPEVVEIDDSGRGRLLQSLKSVLTSSVFKGTIIFGKFYTLIDLLTILMKEIKTRAEAEIGHELTSAVIGRPVKYVGKEENSLALERMQQIAKNSGFKHIEFEYEPVGAALNYAKQIKTPQNILVFDFGGGTLDICIMRLPSQEIIAVSGRGIGGDLLDSQIAKAYLLHHFGSTAIINNKINMPKHFFAGFNSWYETTLQKTIKNIDSLRQLSIQSDQPEKIHNLISLINHDYGFEFFRTVDEAKIALSDFDTFNFDFSRPQLSIQQPLTRSGFEESIINELEESQKCIYESLTQAGLKPNQIDKVILTGGSSQIPVFIHLISDIFSSDKLIVSDHFTSVAAGLALRAEKLFSC
ncbi:MAG: Hsp70 family protein [Microgenomates group bacterium]